MKIVKCTKCKKFIHKADKCFYCGNTRGFDNIELPAIHENVAAEHARVASLVENRKYSEAQALAHRVVEWMPNLASIFWLRLLAKNKCSGTTELIQKGFNCQEDPDFCNALAFSTGAEHLVYQDVQNLVLKFQKLLKTAINDHEHQSKVKTDIIKYINSMRSEVDARKKKLFSLWAKLEETENSMYTLEKQFILLSKEHKDALNKAVQESELIKNEVYRLEECTAEDLHKYQVRIGTILQQSEQARDAIEDMKKQHPWIESFNDLLRERDTQVYLIGKEISSLKIYEATVQQTLDEIERIEKRHRSAIRAVEAFDFSDVANLLGRDRYNAVLRKTGVGANNQMAVSDHGWQSDTDYSTVTEEADKDDYYSAWDISGDSF